MSARRKTVEQHTIVKIDETGCVFCSCGTRCRDGIKITAREVWQQHAESFR